MFKTLRANLALFVATLVLCCVLYPAALWGFGQLIVPARANGDLLTRPDGTALGSAKLAQAFGKDEYFWPRPSAADYKAAAAGGSNFGAAQTKLRDRAAALLGPLVRYTKGGPRQGRPVGPDIDAWFAAAPDRVAKWVSDYPSAAAEWAKGSDVAPVILAWAAARPDAKPDAKAEEVVGDFLTEFVKANPGSFPAAADKKLTPAKGGPAVQAAFFDAWLQDPANAEKAADIEPVPADFVTASGSGLDPHITARNARWQADRVAARRSAPGDAERVKQKVAELIAAASSGPLLGLAGEPLVNVLELNLALDRDLPTPPESK